MPRLARSVFAQVPHHITQRGNRRDPVFFTDEDRHACLDWLREYAGKYAVEVLAYCLMTNHIHLVAVPKTEDGLQRALNLCTCAIRSASTAVAAGKAICGKGDSSLRPWMKPTFGRQFAMSSAIRCVLE